MSKLCFQMSAQVYSVPGQSEGRRKAYFEWKNIYLSTKLSLICGSNFNYYKGDRHPIPTHGNRKHPGNFQNKSVSSLFSWVSKYVFFLAELNFRGRPFLEGARRGTTLPPRALGCHSFCEIWNNPTPPLFLIRPSYK